MKPNERIDQHVHESEKREMMELLHEMRLATIRGDLEHVKTCLVKGIAVDQPLKGGWTALMYACSLGHYRLVQHFLQLGANPNFHKELFTPLMATCASTQVDEDKLVRCVDLLLKHGANVNTAERHHMTALMFAAKDGHNKVVARLLTSTCNIDARDSQGWTALFWAVNQGRANVVEILVAKGARLDLEDIRGQTITRLAENKKNGQILGILSKTHCWPPDSHVELDYQSSQEKQSNYLFGKGTDDVLQAFLNEISAPGINNNDRCESTFTKLIKSMELQNDLEALKVQGQVFTKMAQTVNKCLQNSIIAKKFSNKVSGKENKSMEMSWKNIPYSAVEAREVLKHLVQHIENMYTNVSYVRLHMQGNPPAALLEDKYATISEINALSDKALLCTQLLYDELYFFHQYAKQLEGSDRIVPADLIVEQKTQQSHTKIISSCVIAAAIVVLIFNSRVLTLSVFSK